MMSARSFNAPVMRSAAWLFVLFLLGHQPLAANDFSMRGYYLENFSAEKGLPQNTINALLQTRDGYLWIVTPFGLARFDGVTFKTFTPGNTPGLKENMFTALAEDGERVLWAGTRDGLLRYENGQFERLDEEHGLPHTRVDALSGSREGGIWAGTAKGIAYVTGRVATVVVTNHSIRTLFEDSQGRLWFSIDSSVFMMRDRHTPPEIIVAHESLRKTRVTCFTEDDSGAVWFGTRYHLYRWREGALDQFSRYGEDLPSRMEFNRVVRSVLQDRASGGMWVALDGEEGLHLFKDGMWSPIGSPEWPALRRVRLCLQDVEGNFWLGTDTHGLLRLRRPRLQTFGVSEGLLNDCVWSVAASRDGGIWAGAHESFSRIIDQAQSYRPPETWREAVIRSIFEDRSGRVWLGDHGRGLYQFQDGQFTNIRLPGITKAIYEDRSGTLWIGTHRGMTSLRGNTTRHFTPADGLSHRDVRAFLEDRRGRLWVGTYGGGVNIFSNGTFRVLDGISSHKAWSFHEDADGVIWIGTDAGLNRYENGHIFIFTRKHGLFDDLVNHVVEDDAGMFWISCNRGIYRVSRKELNDVAAGRIAAASHVAYGEADGMGSSETNGEYQPAGCKTADGRIWFPTQRGVVVIDPKTVYRNELPPPVIIEQVIARRRVVFGAHPSVIPVPVSGVAPGNSSEPMRLAPGQADVLEIRYTANSFVEPSKVMFRHRLIGHSSEFSPPDASRIAHYTNLRPGTYRFHVIACNNHGYWNETGDDFSFIVEPHFYETWTFYGLCALGVITGAAGVQAYRLKVQRQVLRLEQRAALQRERERIAKDMHDDLGANLTRIAILSENAKHQAEDIEHVRSTADTISDMARRVIDNLSEIVWVTNPRNDTLDNLVGYLRGYAAEFFELTSLRCRIDFPDHVPAITMKGELRRDILLVFKEALNNVARHSRATEVKVLLQIKKLSSQAWRLAIEIQDNGQGLNEAQTSPGSNGLRNMRERMATRGGEWTVEPAPGGGTLVKIKLDLHGEFHAETSTTFM